MGRDDPSVVETPRGRLPGPISRRRLLQAASVGGIGALTGAGVHALYTAGDTFVDNVLAAGEIDLTTTWLQGPTGGATVTDGGLSLDIGPLSPGEYGRALLEIDLPQEADPNNPAYVWLRTRCPTPASAVLSDLWVSVEYADASGTRLSVPSNPVFQGSLCELSTALRNGVGLDGDPLTPGVDCLDTASGDPLYLLVRWRLSPSFVGDAGSSMRIGVAATQCRHSDGSASPFPPVAPCDCDGDRDYRGISFVEIWGCAADAPDCACTYLGKIELDDRYASRCGAAGISENHIATGRYALYEDDDCDDPSKDTHYDVLVTGTEEQDGETVGIAFELLERGTNVPGPDLCRVVLKGGPGTVTYNEADLAPRSHRTEGLLVGVTA